MGEWTAWYRVIKETGPNRKYLYLQRSRRVPGRKDPETEDHSCGRWNANPTPRKRRPFVAAKYEQSAGGLGLGLLGRHDQFGRPMDSIYNRMFHKDELEKRWAEEDPKPEPEKPPKFYDQASKPQNDEAAPQSEAANESAGAGNGDSELSE